MGEKGKSKGALRVKIEMSCGEERFGTCEDPRVAGSIRGQSLPQKTFTSKEKRGGRERIAWQWISCERGRKGREAKDEIND
jgi:hypothetical protein